MSNKSLNGTGGKAITERNTIVVDLVFGDSRKGGTVDYLARHSDTPTIGVRFNGGPQAAHNVVTAAGTHHTFSHFSSGTFAGSETYMAKDMLVYPFAFFNELDLLAPKVKGIPLLNRTSIHPDARFITPYHQIANRLKEMHRAKSNGKHGSCGMGIGETMADWERDPSYIIYGHMTNDYNAVRGLLERTRERKITELAAIVRDLDGEQAHTLITQLYSNDTLKNITETYVYFNSCVKWMDYAQLKSHADDIGATLIWEGAQGVLIDELYGFNPYTTWSTTTSKNARAAIQEIFGDDNGGVFTIGLARSYFSRHGVGPFPTEFKNLGGEIIPMPMCFEPHNLFNQWQDGMRWGALDFVLMRYAIAATDGVDAIGISHLDQLSLVGARSGKEYDKEIDYCAEYCAADGAAINNLSLPAALQDSFDMTDAIFRVKPIIKSVPYVNASDGINALVLENTGIPVLLNSFGVRSTDQMFVL